MRMFLMLLIGTLAATACGDGGTTNLPPTADAGKNSTVEIGRLSYLDGSGSFDPEGVLLSYRWRVVDSPSPILLTADPSSPAASFIANAIGKYQFTLVVNDGESDSGPRKVTVRAVLPFQEEYDHFDPYEVYIVGTTRPGGDGAGAIGLVRDLSRVHVGFDRFGPEGPVIRGTDGRLLYTQGEYGIEKVREFVCDDCWRFQIGAVGYPFQPEMNDPIISFGCPDEIMGRVRVWPDDGKTFAYCHDGSPRDEEGPLANASSLEGTLGWDRHVLLEGVIVDYRTLESYRVHYHITRMNTLAVRAIADGFWVALTNDDHQPAELVLIEMDGVSRVLMTYSTPLPEPFGAVQGALDGAGNLYAVNSDADDGQTYRFNFADGSVDLVYDLSASPTPRVSVQRSRMFLTGEGALR